MRRLLALSLIGFVPAVWLACGDDEAAVVAPASDAGSDAATVTTPNDASTTTETSTSADAGPPCPPPTDPSKAALCLYLTPEPIDFEASDPDFDGKGVLGVVVHNDPDGEEDAGTQIGAPIVLPAQPDSGAPDAGPALLDLTATLPMVRIDNLPTTIYVRAAFFDSAFRPNELRAGWWLAGHDLTNGLLGSKLAPITLTAGKGTNVTLDLRALRKLTVAISRDPAVDPIGNAQGPAASLAIEGATATQGVKSWGLAGRGCANVSGSNTALLEGLLMGTGPYYLTATVDDFDAGGAAPPGALVSYKELIDGGAILLDENKLSYGPKQYKVTHAIKVNHTLPRQGAPVDFVRCGQ